MGGNRVRREGVAFPLAGGRAVTLDTRRCGRKPPAPLRLVRYASAASMSSFTFPLSAFDTGQPSLVACAILANASLEIPGTVARTTSFIVVIEKPSPTFSTVHPALVAILVGGEPACSRPTLSAMLKQAASAAASSSSGLVPGS